MKIRKFPQRQYECKEIIKSINRNLKLSASCAIQIGNHGNTYVILNLLSIYLS